MIGVKPEGADGAAVHVIGGAVDTAWVRDFAQAHERPASTACWWATPPPSADGFLVPGYAAAHTERLGYLIAHRPGFVAPTLAARKAATLDHVQRAGASRCTSSPAAATPSRRRTATSSTTTRAMAAPTSTSTSCGARGPATEPFDHEGEFYRVRRRRSPRSSRCRQPHIPIYFGGASDAAAPVAAKHCDVYALWGEPLAAVRQRIADVRAEAARVRPRARASASRSARSSRRPRTQAWERARRILAGDARPDRARCERAVHAPAGGGRAAARGLRARGRGTRQAPVDADRRGHGRRRQHHRAGGHARAGGRVAARLLRHRRARRC